MLNFKNFLALEKSDDVLKGKTVLITAGNRGGGAMVALRYAASRANVVILVEKELTHTNINDISDRIVADGGKAITLEVNFSDVKEINSTVEKIISHFGCIDILINNFSIFNFKTSIKTTPEEFNKVMGNVFATFFFSQACIPYLQKSENPHVINISPPLDMASAKAACEHHLLFSLSKYGMSFCTMGMAEEFKKFGIAFNSLWQERPILTPTLIKNFSNEIVKGCNKPEIYAEAAYVISLKSSKQCSGNYYIDGDIMREAGIDVNKYAVDPAASPVIDIFLPEVNYNIFCDEK